MKNYIILIMLLCVIYNANSTPNLIVEFNRIHLQSTDVSIDISKSKITDQLDSIVIKTKSNTFTVSKDILKKIWGVNLQDIMISESISMQQYQMYIEFALFSNNGKEPNEEEKLSEFELTIYFNNSEINDIYVRENGNYIKTLFKKKVLK